MKKSLIALAALAATGAFAQSSVSLTGGINAGLARAGGATKIDTNQAAATYLTFTAVEDLGSGLKATALVNVRFSPATGMNTSNGSTTNAAAGDDAFAQNVSFGVAGGFGEVKAGRFTGLIQGPMGKFDPFGTDDNGVAVSGKVDPATGATSGATTVNFLPVRYNSMVAYVTPSFGGLKGGIQWADKNGNATGKNGYELAGYYDNGPLALMVGSTKVASSDSTTNSVYAAYDLGMVRPSFLYAKNSDLGIKQTAVGLTAPVGAFLVKAGYRVTDTAGADVKRTALGVTYTLSKRTSLIADMNKDTAVKTAYYFGVRHTF